MAKSVFIRPCASNSPLGECRFMSCSKLSLGDGRLIAPKLCEGGCPFVVKKYDFAKRTQFEKIRESCKSMRYTKTQRHFGAKTNPFLVVFKSTFLFCTII
jgi:hypothetical protein